MRSHIWHSPSVRLSNDLVRCNRHRDTWTHEGCSAQRSAVAAGANVPLRHPSMSQLEPTIDSCRPCSTTARTPLVNLAHSTLSTTDLNDCRHACRQKGDMAGPADTHVRNKYASGGSTALQELGLMAVRCFYEYHTVHLHSSIRRQVVTWLT